MYKLLVTTALVAMTATSASAWTDAETVIKNLNDVYTNLDGQAEYDALAGTDGELTTFLSTVNQGVTHLSLEVSGNNQITATLHEGVDLQTITNAAGELVNRVNYDVFVDDSHLDVADQLNATYVKGTDYTTQANLVFTDKPGTDPVQVTSNHTNGLLGIQIQSVVTGVDDINTTLIGTTDENGEALKRSTFIDEWKAAEADGTLAANNTTINGIQTNIANLNTVANLVGTTADGTGFNDALNGVAGITDGTRNLFNVPGIQADGQVTLAAETYGSLLEWAKRND